MPVLQKVIDLLVVSYHVHEPICLSMLHMPIAAYIHVKGGDMVVS